MPSSFSSVTLNPLRGFCYFRNKRYIILLVETMDFFLVGSTF